MTTSAKISIVEKIASDLALRSSAKILFNILEKLPEKTIIVDFKNVKSISRSFAHEYITRKKSSTKNFKEVNFSASVRKMFTVVKEPKAKAVIIDPEQVEMISL